MSRFKKKKSQITSPNLEVKLVINISTSALRGMRWRVLPEQTRNRERVKCFLSLSGIVSREVQMAFQQIWAYMFSVKEVGQNNMLRTC